MNIQELTASLKDLLKDGTPTVIEPLVEHPLKNKFWRDVANQRLFKVLEVHEQTILLREIYEINLYNDPRLKQHLQDIHYHTDGLSNRSIFEDNINDGELIEVIKYGNN